MSTAHYRDRIEADERNKVFLELQKKLEGEGSLPRSPRLMLRRGRRFFEYTAEVLIGIIIGQFAVILSYLIINVMLHLQF